MKRRRLAGFNLPSRKIGNPLLTASNVDRLFAVKTMKLIDSSVWKIVYRRGLRTRDTRKQVLKCKDIAHPVSIITLVSISSRFRDFEISRRGGTRPRNCPTVSLYLKSAMPTNLMCHRYPYGSFAEFSGVRIRGKRRGLLTNARDIDCQQRKESAWFLNKGDSVCPELRSAKDYAKRT